MTALRFMRSLPDACGRSTGVFLRDVGQGLLEVSHNTLALVGLAVVAVLVFAAGRADLRDSAEHYAYDWLQARQEAKADVKPAENASTLVAYSEPDAVARATAADPHDLTRQQAAVAQWISQRYRVAPEPISRLVQEAWSVGPRAGLDPTLILAIMAVESSFNPFAQSSVGAQGLMQVMTRVHDAKYEVFGGKHAAFDPVTNLRVGAEVLKECIQHAGGLEAGLRFYVGAGATDDGGYAAKVLAEQSHMKMVAGGRKVPPNAPLPVAVVHTAPEAHGAPAPSPVADVPADVPVVAPEAKQAAARVPEQVALLH